MSSTLYALGLAVARVKGRVIIIWAVLILLLGSGALIFHDKLDTSISIPGLESTEALVSLANTFPELAGTSAQLLVQAPPGHRVDEPAYVAPVKRAITQLEQISQVTYVISPYGSEVTGEAISDDRQLGIISVQISYAPDGYVTDHTYSALAKVTETLDLALPEDAQALIGGGAYSYVLPSVGLLEIVGVLIAFIVLIVTFGALLAALLPITIALAGVAVSTALIFLATLLTPIFQTTPIMSLMLGMAVGIDYSLFIIFRHRQQLAAGIAVDESIGRAIATAGSAVVFAGMTVIVALLGLGVAGVPFLTTMGNSAALGVAMAVAAALTLLPALLAYAGDRIRPKSAKSQTDGDGTGAVPGLRAGAASPTPRPGTAASPKPAHGSAFFAGWAHLVTRRPIITVIAVVVAMGLCSLPVLDLRLALPDAGWRSTSDEPRRAYDTITEHFGEGYNATLVVTASIITSTDPLKLMDDMAAEIRRLPGVAEVPLATPNPTADTGIIQIIPTTGPDAAATVDLVKQLRGLHDHFLERYDVDIKVTGLTAVMIDVSAKLSAAMLPFALIVVGLSFVLLMIVFRSLWVPLKAALGYLLSVGVGIAAVVVVLQYGFASDLLGVPKQGPIIAFMPIVVMGVLFGLAMDYELFLVSRMREEYAHGATASEAVIKGFTSSAPVVTAAALIMFVVFAGFVPRGDLNIKPMALGLAAGVFVDAFVVRMTFVPAVLTLLGDRAWRLPRWLDERLPHVDVEGEGLVRELALSDWPEPDTTALLAAEAVLVPTATPGVNAYWSTRLEVGQSQLVVAADKVAATSALLLATGRLSPAGGRLKVMGYALPGRSGRVRHAATYLDLSQVDEPAQALSKAMAERPRLLAIDGLARIADAGQLAAIKDELIGCPDSLALLIAVDEIATAQAVIQAETCSVIQDGSPDTLLLAGLEPAQEVGP